MGIRESLLNTITSVGSSDFVRIVTSAGASSKATLQNVIKSFETGLGAKSSLADSDYIRIVGSDNNLYKQSVNDVEKRIIEDYTGSSLGGATQSVKSAFSAFRGIPSNTNKRLAYLGTSANFDTITAEWSLGLGSNGPTTNAFYYVHTIAFESAADGTVVNGKQIAYSYTTDTEAVYVRHRANNAWTAWEQQPTRAEVDALTKHDITTYVDLASYTSTWYTFPSDGYLTASCGSSSNSIAIGRVGGSSLNATFSFGGYGNGTYGSWTTFVRAGMKAQAVRLENSGTLYFRPLS